MESPSLLLPPLMDAVLPIHWTPEQEGNVRGVLALRTSTGVKSQAILLGTGRPLQAAKKVRQGIGLGSGARCWCGRWEVCIVLADYVVRCELKAIDRF